MNIVGVGDATSTVLPWVPFATGWLLGWALLARARRLPPAKAGPRPAVSVVVPARDEARALPHLLGPLTGQLRAGDEAIVVDDHSGDDTGRIASGFGARVVVPPTPPTGWLGKPNACWHGTAEATTGLLLFLDADVRPGPELVDRIAAALERHPEAVVSVQPWHEPGSASEQLSVFCNVAALMAAGHCSVLAPWVRPRVAFGPVLAMTRATYDAIGGHAHPDVRSAHTEDIAIARRARQVELFTGRPEASFRMYPGGLGELVGGWTRSIASGAGAASRWAAIATAGWIWAIAAAPFLAWWAYALAAAEVAMLARRAGRFSPIVAAVYPVPLALFVVVVAWSLVQVAFRRDVTWKGRRVAAR